MKNVLSILVVLLGFVSIGVANAPQHFETTIFKVYGNCTMCKKTIETALKKNPHVKAANWNVSSKMITIEYDPHAISLTELHLLIANAGYDTDKEKAPNVAYNKLPGCCKYERAH